MDLLIGWVIVFGIVVIFNLLFVVLNKKKRRNIFNAPGALIMKYKFKANYEGLSEKKFAFVIGLANGVIVATTYVIMRLFSNIYISFVVAIPILFILIIIVYFLLSLFYKKKEVDKNV